MTLTDATVPDAAMKAAGMADAAITELFKETGIDLSGLPQFPTAAEVARALNRTEGALAQDRYKKRGMPFIRAGRSIRYVRSDIANYLLAHREEPKP